MTSGNASFTFRIRDLVALSLPSFSPPSLIFDLKKKAEPNTELNKIMVEVAWNTNPVATVGNFIYLGFPCLSG